MSSPTFGAERLIICDASPLILLAKVAQLELVSSFAREVWIPDSVWFEITAPPRRPEMAEIERLFSRSIGRVDSVQPSHFEDLRTIQYRQVSLSFRRATAY